MSNDVIARAEQWLDTFGSADSVAESYVASLVAECRRLQEENQQFRTWGVIEVAVRNPNVSSYMDHWESRATTAESALVRLRAQVREKASDRHHHSL